MKVDMETFLKMTIDEKIAYVEQDISELEAALRIYGKTDEGIEFMKKAIERLGWRKGQLKKLNKESKNRRGCNEDMPYEEYFVNE